MQRGPVSISPTQSSPQKGSRSREGTGLRQTATPGHAYAQQLQRSGQERAGEETQRGQGASGCHSRGQTCQLEDTISCH